MSIKEEIHGLSDEIIKNMGRLVEKNTKEIRKKA